LKWSGFKYLIIFAFFAIIIDNKYKKVSIFNKQAHQRHELETRARDVLSRAFHVLEELNHSGRAQLVQGIEHEIVRIEELIYELRTHSISTLEGEHGHRIELRLAQHIKRLDEELNQTAR
jgi:sensor histidine kinase regulating citrate/malate metabolism